LLVTWLDSYQPVLWALVAMSAIAAVAAVKIKPAVSVAQVQRETATVGTQRSP
jgi:hypothetical protein